MQELMLPKVTVILRGYNTGDTLFVIEQLVGSRLNSVEIAFNSPNAVDTIAAAKERFASEIHVGAGTITTMERARAVIAAGAEFMLSPVAFTKEMIDCAHRHGVLTVPSAFSPTEVLQMKAIGADIIKIFPAIDLGARYLKDIQAPLGDLPLMVVGGVNAGNIAEFFSNGATYAGIGSGIFDKQDVIDRNADNLKASIKKLEDSISW